MDEKRTNPRRRILKGARIVFNDRRSTIDCQVRNVSDTGARLKVASILDIPETFELRFDDGRIEHARLAWKTESEIGVEFIAGA